jgi:hypothetical protein
MIILIHEKETSSKDEDGDFVLEKREVSYLPFSSQESYADYVSKFPLYSASLSFNNYKEADKYIYERIGYLATVLDGQEFNEHGII